MVAKPGNNSNPKPKPKVLRFTLYLLSLFWLSGCLGGNLSTDEVVFTSDHEINNGRPFLVNIVLVKDKQTLNKISNLTSVQYFEQLEQLKSDNNLAIYEYDAKPGKKLTVNPPIWNGAFTGGMVFVRVTDEGVFRAVLPNKSTVTINIDVDGVSVDGQASGSVLGNIKQYLNGDELNNPSEQFQNNDLLKKIS